VPDLTVEVALICPMWASNFQVMSSTGDAKYNVTINPYDPPNCTCPAFKFSGEYGNQDCKHIQKVKANGCFYHSHTNPRDGELSWNEFNFDNNGIEWLNSGGPVMDPKIPCPGCGGPMIAVRFGV